MLRAREADRSGRTIQAPETGPSQALINRTSGESASIGLRTPDLGANSTVAGVSLRRWRCYVGQFPKSSQWRSVKASRSKDVSRWPDSFRPVLHMRATAWASARRKRRTSKAWWRKCSCSSDHARTHALCPPVSIATMREAVFVRGRENTPARRVDDMPNLVRFSTDGMPLHRTICCVRMAVRD